jgi:hypothetical protein
MALRKSLFFALWALTIVLYSTIISPTDTALATTRSISCWTSGQGNGTCTGNTTWFTNSTEGLYYAYGRSSNSSYLDIYKWADLHGTNIYHNQELFEQAFCEAGGFTSSCTTESVPLCSTLAPPAGCGSSSNTQRWYATTNHYWDNGQTWFDVYTATTTQLNRESYTCWYGMYCVTFD